MLLAEITQTNGINLALLLLRVVVGVTIFLHGYNHVWGGGKIEGTARWFASLGMKPGIVHAWLASITELVCGVLLVAGFLTPLAADYSTVPLDEEESEEIFEDQEALVAEIARLDAAMRAAAERLDFEEAAAHRDRIRYLETKGVLA